MNKTNLIQAAALAGAIGVAVSTGTAQASLLVYDGFNYTAATKVPDTASSSVLNGGTGGGGSNWSGGWFDASPDSGANAYTITNGGLSYSTLTTGGNALNRGDDNIGVRRNFTAQSDGTYYTSFLFSVGADPANTYAGLAVAGRAYFGLAKFGTHSEFVVGNGFAGTPASTGITVQANTTYLLVGKIAFSATGNDTVSLWVNPTGSNEANAGAAGASYVNSSNFTTLDNVQAYQSTAAYNMTLDEFRLGTTWADVTPGLPTPEPASLGLLAGAGYLVIRRRSRTA